MSTTAVLDEALKLTDDERLRLIDALWESLDDMHRREVEGSQIAEAEERLAAYERGEIKSHDGASVIAEMKRINL